MILIKPKSSERMWTSTQGVKYLYARSGGSPIGFSDKASDWLKCSESDTRDGLLLSSLLLLLSTVMPMLMISIKVT